MYLYSHGLSGGVTGPDGQRIAMTGGLAEILKKNGWRPGMSVVFVACNTGRRENSIAEQFSKHYNTPTMAPDRQVWYSWFGPSNDLHGQN